MDNAKNQELTPARISNWVPFDLLIKRRNELKKEYEKNKSDNYANQRFLILALYTLQPPIRQDYKVMKIIKSEKENDRVNNFVIKSNNRYFVILNKDKVSKTYGPLRFPLPEVLNNILDDSLKNYPRDYILSLNMNPAKPIQKHNLEQLLTNIFEEYKLSVDIFR
jgi:hypothetical protein